MKEQFEYGKRFLKAVSFIAIFMIFLLACKKTPQSQGPVYRTSPLSKDVQVYYVAVLPVDNPAKIFTAYQPLVDYVNERLKGFKLELEASRDYADFEEKIRGGKPEFLLPNPWQTLQAMKSGYDVMLMAGDPSDFKGFFIVRRDGGIRQPADLRGKAVSYPSPTALAACIMPQYFLHQHGIHVNTETINMYVGSQEPSILNVYLNKTSAGAAWPPAWRVFQNEHPKESSEMKVIWETPHLINNSFMARKDIPVSVRDQVRRALVHLNDTPHGKGLLKGIETKRFKRASNADYDIVRRYIDRFEKEVRPVRSQ